MEVYDLTGKEIKQETDPEEFKIKCTGTQKGIFYLVRCLWNTTAKGKRWQIIVLNVATFIFMPLAIVLDLVFIILYLLWLSIKWTIKRLAELIIKLLEKFFTKLIYPTLTFLLKISVIIVLIIILIFKFDFIRNLILTTFDSFIK